MITELLYRINLKHYFLFTAFLFTAFLFAPSSSVSATEYWPDGDGNGIPDFVQWNLAFACGGAQGARTYHYTWADPWDVTPPRGATTATTQLRAAAYICPGVTYSYSNNITHTVTSMPQGMTLSNNILYLGNTTRGNYTSVAARTVTINLSLVNTSTCSRNFTYSGYAYPGGTYSSFANAVSSFTLCVSPSEPDIELFTVSANCSTASVRATTPLGDRYDVRLLNGNGTDTPYVNTNIVSGATTTFDMSYWRDFGTHSFLIRVRNTVTGKSTTNAIQRTMGPCLEIVCATPSITTSPSPPQTGNNFTATARFNIVRRGTTTSGSIGSRGNNYNYYIRLQITTLYPSAQIGLGTLTAGGGQSFINRISGPIAAPAAPGTYAASSSIRNTPTGANIIVCNTSVTTTASSSPPACSPNISSVEAGTPVQFTASGGNYAYSWGGGEPPVILSGSGSSILTTTYTTVGLQTVTVTSNLLTATCTVTVVTKPYFSVNNGDIATGIGNCTDWGGPISGTLTSWNGVLVNYTYGAGTNLATFASNIIDGVASAGGTSPAGRLSFSNVTSTLPYGGYFGGGISCPTDYWNTAATNTFPSAPTNSTWIYVPNTNSVHENTGPITLAGGTISEGNKPVIFIDGDVHVQSNIITTSGLTFNNLSNFYLVVKGDIYINANVTTLHGVYVAQPLADGTKGRIYTCKRNNGFGPPSTSQLNNCSNQLTVNGALIAKEIKFYRSSGTLGSPGFPAEIINYTPNVWLAVPDIFKTSTPNGYDSITSLPPVL